MAEQIFFGARTHELETIAGFLNLINIEDQNPFVELELLKDDANTQLLLQAFSIVEYYPELMFNPNLLKLARMISSISPNHQLRCAVADIYEKIKVANKQYYKMREQGLSFDNIISIIYDQMNQRQYILDIIDDGQYFS